MKILVTGVSGQLGYEVVKQLKKTNYEIIPTGHNDNYSGLLFDEFIDNNYQSLNYINEKEVEEFFNKNKIDIIVHCAAYTQVDKAEDDFDKAYLVNVVSTKNLANQAKKYGCKFIFVSTDYVFKGEGNQAYSPDEKKLEPSCVYGKTKKEAEDYLCSTLEKYFIVRTSWLYGLNGSNFVKTMIKVASNHDEVKVVNDQIGSPTYAKDLAKLLIQMIDSDKYGYYHATNSGEYISWYEFTKEIYRLKDIKIKVTPVTTLEYGLNKAKRPYNSRLDKTKLKDNGFKDLPNWKDALKRFIEELNKM